MLTSFAGGRKKSKIPKGKEFLGVYIDEKIVKELRELISQKYPRPYGALSQEVELALSQWVKAHTHDTQKVLKFNTVNPDFRVRRVFNQVKKYIEEKKGYSLLSGNQLLRTQLWEAITYIRGGDPRTVKKWMDSFRRFNLIKHIAGEVWEII